MEAAGNEEVLRSVERLEYETNLINTRECKEELTDRYIRKGNLSYDYAVVHCNTKRVYGPKKDHHYLKKNEKPKILKPSSFA